MEPPRTHMDDLQDLLEENLELAKENNKLLKTMRRDAFIGALVKTLLWLVAIGVSVYFTLQYLDPLLAPMQGMDTNQYKALFEMYTGQFGQ